MSVSERKRLFGSVFILMTLLCACEGCGDIGTSNPGAHISSTGTGTGLTFFIGTAASPCCGTLNNWKFYATSNGDVTMHLWRPTLTAGSYELIAQQPFTASVGLNTNLATGIVEVETGDLIGWSTSGAERIPFSANPTGSSSTQSQVLAPTVLGTEVPWGNTPDTTNTYAAGAVVTANEDPVIVDDSVTITDSMTLQSIFTIDVTDTDTVSLVATTSGFTVTRTSGSSLFSVLKTTAGYTIRSGSSLSTGIYPLTITATDRCGATDTAIITVTVTNTVPVFVPVSLQTVHLTPISDDTTTARSLYAFDVTDASPITCTVDNTKFEIKTVGSGYELWLKAGLATTLNHDVTAMEAMTINCSDGTDQITSNYNVDISDAVPVLTNFAGTSGPLGDLSPVGTSVHQFTVTDQDDAIFCTINAPESAKFGVTKVDTATGAQRFDVKTIAGLDYDSATSYTITVSCTDAINTVPPSSRTINIADDKPVLTGLPATLSPARADGLQTATLLRTFSVTDANDQSVITCSIQAPQDSFFNVVAGSAPTFAIWVKAGVTLDAASSPILVNVQCVDDRSANVVTETFTVPLLDKPPTFVSGIPGNSPSISDKTVIATSLGVFTVTDPDTTCSITSPTTSVYEIKPVTLPVDAQKPEFEVWISAAVIQASIDFNDQTVPLTLTIRCTDGNTAITGTFNVNIVDEPPVITALPATGTAINDGLQAAATDLNTFSVTDSDDTVTCTVRAPQNARFEVVPGTSPEFIIRVKAGATLAAASGPYVMNVDCTDGVTPVSLTFTQPVINTPPTFVSGMPGSSVTVPDSTVIETLLGKFKTTDPDTTCSVTSPSTVYEIRKVTAPANPQQPEFEVWIKSTVTQASIDFNDQTVPLPLTIKCTDGNVVNDITGTFNVNIVDAPPLITVLPLIGSAIDDGLQAAATLQTFSVTDSDDVVTCSIRAPEDARFEVVAGTSPAFNIRVKAGVTLAAVNTPYVMNVDCTDNDNTVSSTFTQPVLDKKPIFVTGIPGTSGTVSDDTLTATSLGKFTTTDPDTKCSVTSPATTVYEIRNVTLPTNPQQPEFEVWIGTAVTQASINFNSPAVPLPLTITCTDGNPANVITGTFNVNIVNAPPAFTALPANGTTLFDGLKTAAETLHTFSVADSDDTVTCSARAPEATLFEVVAGVAPGFTINVKAGVTLKAANGPYVINVDCSDGTNAVTESFTQPVIDTPPTFVSGIPGSSPTVSDATVVQTLLGKFTTTDPDTTCSVTSPVSTVYEVRKVTSPANTQQPEFEVWIASTVTEAAIDFNDQAVPLTLTIRCTDGNVVNDITGSFNVTIVDEDPVLTSFPTTSYTFLEDTSVAALQLNSFSLKDSDDVLSCKVDPATPEATHFEIRAGTVPAFQIWYKGSPPAFLNYDVTPVHNVTIMCDDGAVFSSRYYYAVELINSPPVFLNLPATTLPSIEESVTSKTLLYTLTVFDLGVPPCYLSDTALAAGILPLEQSTVTPPETEYLVYAHNPGGFDFERSNGAVNVEITCGDSVSTVKKTLIVNILNSAPVITNPGGSSDVAEDVSGTLTLKTLDFVTFDKSDTTCSMANADGGPFAVIGNQIVKTAGVLDFETKATYNLDVTCTDGLLPTTDTYVVNVQNVGPEITSLPTAATLNEWQTTEVQLTTLTLTENASDCVQTSPNYNEFNVKYEPATAVWVIYYVSEAVAGRPLSYDTNPFYNLHIQCSDAAGAKGREKIFTVHINDNQPPVFDNLSRSPITKLSLVAKDFKAADTVFTATGSDEENDAVTYSMMSCISNATCPFIMSPNGDIVTNADLHSYPNNSFKLSVVATDKYNKNPTPYTVIVEITYINTRPKLTNVPKIDVLAVYENNAAGDVIYDVNHEDPDAGDVIKYFCNFIDGGVYYFTCDSATGEIRAKSVINFEKVNKLSYEVEIHAYDGYANSTTETLTLLISDVNEKPEFTTTTWTITKNDEGGPGEQISCPDFKNDINDDDVGDVHTYKMSCPRGRGVFVMDPLTGCVTMTKEWDLDAADKRLGEETVVCTVTATDRRGLETTATFNIKIKEEDDNKPFLSQTSYVYCATVGATSGSLGQVTSTDNDVLPAHQTKKYEFVGSGPFYASGTGSLTYGDLSSYAKGTKFETTLRVTDSAGHYDESPVTIFICDPPPPVPSNPNSASGASSATATSDGLDNFLYWLIPALLLLALMAGLAVFLIRRCIQGGRCGSCYQSRAVKTIRPLQVPGRVQTRVITAREVEERAVYRKAPTPSSSSPPPPPPPPTTEKGTIAPCELPIVHYHARDVGNLGAMYPKY